MMVVTFATTLLDIALLTRFPDLFWPRILAAVLLGVCPLAIALFSLPSFQHPLRWATVSIFGALSFFLVAFPLHTGSEPSLALNALYFAIFFDCCLHFWYTARHLTTGAFITTAGFFAWASVFVVAPGMRAFAPSIHLESEVWNLPKYVVAVGMILLLLEDQIEHNKHLALHDELTGLPNRRLFQDRLASALERARRAGSQTALLLIDLDYFKEVNDTAGHHIGDLLLKHAGHIFLDRVRRSDTVARTGGDEFSIILEAPTSRVDAEHVGRSLMQMLCEPVELNGHTVCIGGSVGIAMFPEDAPEADALRIAADRRMYANKHGSADPPRALANSELR
jgi:diguanylate cyclase (GGDEF)-like protein